MKEGMCYEKTAENDVLLAGIRYGDWGGGITPIPFSDSEQIFAMEDPTGPTSGTCGENITWELTVDEEAEWDLVQGTPYKLILTGSGEMDDYKSNYDSVNGIWNTNVPWGDYCSMITSISIAEGITSIGGHAFFQCVSLQSIVFPDSVRIIGSHAFFECVSLKSIMFPNSVTVIGNSAFDYCSQLETVIFGSGLKKIGAQAFHQNNSLATIQFQDGLEIIGSYAFSQCYCLKEISIPDSVTTLEPHAFEGMYITSFTVPRNVTPATIGDGVLLDNYDLERIQVAEGNPYFAVLDHVLYEMKDGVPYRAIACAYASLGSEISIAEGTEIINCEAFQYAGITSVNLPNTLKSIQDSAFSCCRNLKEVNIPDSVELIEMSAFFRCTRLSSVTIGKGLQTIETGWVFRECFALGDITVSEENPYLDAIDNVIYNEEHTHLYFCAPARPNKEWRIPDTVESLSIMSITYVSNLKALYIPEKIITIPYYAIADNSNLQDIFFLGNAPILDRGTESISDNADDLIIYRAPDSTGWDDSVWSNYNLANWDPKNPARDEGLIGDICWNYEGNTGRITFTGKGELPDFTDENPAPWDDYVGSIQMIETHGISGIGNHSFSDAQKLLRLETDADLKRIGDYAFSDCGSMMYFDIAAAEVIGAGAFQNAISIRVPLTLEKVSSIGSGAFRGCATLTNATLGSCLGSLEEDVFADCAALTSLIIPESVTEIKAGALKNCVSLRTANIPTKVELIGTQAFSGDAALEKVYFYGDVPQNWDIDSFIDCSGDLTLYYRKSQTEWEQFNGLWNGMNLVGLDRFYTERQDHFSFDNSADSFGYESGYRIPRQRYVDVLDSITTGTYFYVADRYWKGSCYGMVSTSLEFYENKEDSKFQVKKYDPLAESLFDIDVPNAELTKLIEGYQISQYKPEISGWDGEISRHMCDYKGLIQKVEEFERSGGLRTDMEAGPVIMTIYAGFFGHAVIPVSVDQAKNGDFLLQVYDPDYPSAFRTLTVYKDFSGISYDWYYYASYVDYSAASSAMSRVHLYSDESDSSIYLSIDKEDGVLTDSEGKTIDEIEGAYEQKPFFGNEEDVFSGLRRFVLPEGDYQITTKEEETTEETEAFSRDAAEDEEETVTFYLASEDYCAEITSSDKDTVLEVQKAEKESGELEIRLQSESDNKEASAFTITNQQGMERTVEVEGGNAAVTMSEDNTITVSAEKTISIDGVEVATENGQAVGSFEALEEENPFKAKELNASVSCGADNTLSGEVSAAIVSNAVTTKDVTVKTEYLDKNGKCVASYVKEMTLKKGLNAVSLSYKDLNTDFDEKEGDVVLSCRLTVTDENKHSVVSVADGLKVTLVKQPEPPKEPEEDIGLIQKRQELQETVEKLRKKDLSIYTEESVKIYRAALEKAEEVLENQKATKKEIEEVLENLQETEKILELRNDEKEDEELMQKRQELQKEVEKARKKDLSIYTEGSVKTYRAALEKAEEVLENQKATKKEIEEVLENLQGAEKILELKKIEKEDKNLVQKRQALQMAVQTALKKNLSGYTKESVSLFLEVLSKTQKVLENRKATLLELDMALNDLKKSEEALLPIKKEEKSDKKLPLKDSVFTVKGYRYKVKKSNVKNGQVSLIKVPSKKTVTIPSSVKKNGYTFQVTAIEKNACSNNKTLTKAIIGKNITYIGSKAFFKCPKLKKIIFKGKKAPKIGKQAFEDIKENCKIYISKKMAAKQLKQKMKLAGIKEVSVYKNK